MYVCKMYVCVCMYVNITLIALLRIAMLGSMMYMTTVLRMNYEQLTCT